MMIEGLGGVEERKRREKEEGEDEKRLGDSGEAGLHSQRLPTSPMLGPSRDFGDSACDT